MTIPVQDPRGERLLGWKAIAKCVGESGGRSVSPLTVLAYSRLAEDPLPLIANVRKAGAVHAWSRFLAEWVVRRQGGEGLERVEGWKDICLAIGGADQHTSLRWAKSKRDRLPVHGLDSRGHSRPWAYASALRDWVHRGYIPHQLAHPSKQGWAPQATLAIAGRRHRSD